jgi:hypothetical protein
MAMEDRFDLGPLVRGCNNCGARLERAGKVRYASNSELMVRLRDHVPNAQPTDEFLHLTCGHCGDPGLLFFRSADGRPHFVSVPYEHAKGLGPYALARRTDEAIARLNAQTALPAERIVRTITYDDQGLVARTVEDRYPIAEGHVSDAAARASAMAAIPPRRRMGFLTR